MSLAAPNWYVDQFNAEATLVYQNKGFTFRQCTTPPVKMDGKSMTFRVAGMGQAETNVQRGSDAVPSNNDRINVKLTTSKSRYFAELFEDDVDQFGDLTPAEIQIEAESGAMALGRVHDSTVITELANATTNSQGSAAAVSGLADLLKAKQKLQAQDVPVSDGNVFAAVDSVFWTSLLTYKQFQSADWNGPNLPFVSGALAKTWNGIHVFCPSDSVFPISGGGKINMMWHRSAIGFGYNNEMRTNVVWDNRKDCWTHNMRMRVGAKLLQEKGVCKMPTLYDASGITVTG